MSFEVSPCSEIFFVENRYHINDKNRTLATKILSDLDQNLSAAVLTCLEEVFLKDQNRSNQL